MTCKLYHDDYGSPLASAVILIPGLGGQNITWPQSFCDGLAGAGFYVLNCDNRDSGLSAHCDDMPPPDIQAMMQGKPVDIPYSLSDMADDYAALLRENGIHRAHIIGRSMGGMIAQLFAARYPQMTLSVCAIMSSTGNPALPPPEADVMQMLMSPQPDSAIDRDGCICAQLAFFRRISSVDLPFDEMWYRDLLERAIDRHYSPAGTVRQMAAMELTGDIRASSATITAPALVVHGTADPLFPPAAGGDIAAVIPGARLEKIQGMGHDTPPERVPQLLSVVIPFLRAAG